MKSVLGFFFAGYPYFLNEFRKQGRDVLEMRVVFGKVICMRGKEAAEIFYDQEKFKRKGITPARVKKTLFGEGGVQGLDGQEHVHRKAMFMKVMTPESIRELCEIFNRNWQQSLEQWQQADTVILFDETERVLCRSACEWVGVPLPAGDVEHRTNQLSALIDSPGAVGLRHLLGRLSRQNAEVWLEKMIKDIRKQQADQSSILHSFSFHQDSQGKLLDTHVVAVEILNLLRPIVAIARYIVFSAMALHEFPQFRQRLNENENGLLPFVQEVRRFYPFFPFVGAIVKKSFTWQGFHFKKGRRVLLDLYATNHDENIWKNPEAFSPGRFNDWNESSFTFIPQGGGDHFHNHRCAGEWITIEIMKTALIFLSQRMEYNVPPQDLEIDLSRIPAIPGSRFRIQNVREKSQKEQRVIAAS